MKIMIITDAWEPQVNGVVRTLKQTCTELVAMGHEVEMITPKDFTTIPCPTYPDISLSILPGKLVSKKMKAFAPDAMHIATEGPLGLSARAYAVKNNLPFSTAYHTRFPEYVKARIGVPLSWTYTFLRWFHGPSMAVMAPTIVVKNDLEAYGSSRRMERAFHLSISSCRSRILSRSMTLGMELLPTSVRSRLSTWLPEPNMWSTSMAGYLCRRGAAMN